MSARNNIDRKPSSNDVAVEDNSSRSVNSATKLSTKTKADRVLSQLRRVNGASINQLMATTGWQAHSLRAVISGLRKLGISIVRSKAKNGATVYRAERS